MGEITTSAGDDNFIPIETVQYITKDNICECCDGVGIITVVCPKCNGSGVRKVKE